MFPHHWFILKNVIKSTCTPANDVLVHSFFINITENFQMCTILATKKRYFYCFESCNFFWLNAWFAVLVKSWPEITCFFFNTYELWSISHIVQLKVWIYGFIANRNYKMCEKSEIKTEMTNVENGLMCRCVIFYYFYSFEATVTVLKASNRAYNSSV